MEKLNDWQPLLTQCLEENRLKPFEWGSWDCCKFADTCIKAMTGESLIPKKLKWTDEESAMKAINDYGKDLNGSIAKAAKAKGLQQVDDNHRQRGDLMVIRQESQLVGICDGIKVLGPSESGMAVIPYEEVLSVWRIPNG